MKTILATIIGGWFALLTWVSPAFAQAPSSVAGDGFLVGITSGTYPLASYGYLIFLPANSGNSYQVINIYAIASNVGTYSYSATSSTTGQATLNDTTDGFTDLVGLTFTSAYQGNFSLATISPPGYSQTGDFIGALGSAPNSVSGKSFYVSVADGLYPFASGGYFTIAFSVAELTRSLAEVELPIVRVHTLILLQTGAQEKF